MRKSYSLLPSASCPLPSLIISDLETASPEALQDVVRSFVRADWWSEVRDAVWMGVKASVRSVLDTFDVEVRYGF